MKNLSRRQLAGATAAALAAAAAITTSAVGQTGSATAKQITSSGVGSVKIGATYTSLHNRGLIGTIHRGCELGGPNTRGANLRAPLKGSVDFTLTSPRRVTNITVRGGATARGVGIGATIAKIRAAFPRAVVDHKTDRVFGTTSVRVPKSGGGRIEFAVSTRTKKTVLIGVPFIAACE